MTLFETKQEDVAQHFLGIIRRHLFLFVGSAAVMLAASETVVMQVRPMYRAEARILVEPRQSQVASFEAVMGDLKPDVSVIRSEIDAIASPSMTRHVIDRLGLEADPRILQDSRLAFVHALKQRLLPSTADPHLVEKLLSNLSIENDGRSYVMKVTYRSTYPELASAIVDAYSQAYREQEVEVKANATRQATILLNQQADQLKDEVRKSDEAVQNYSQANGLEQTKGSTVVAQQLAELNSQLVLVTEQRAHKESQLAQSHAGNAPQDDTAVLASPLIQRLREQENELMRQQAEAGQHYQNENARMRTIEASLANVRERIAEETQRIIDSVQGEARELATREATLRRQVQVLTAQLGHGDQASVHLHELERTASANQALYQSLLTRSKQTLAEEQLRSAETRILSAGYTESKPLFPNNTFLAGVSGLGSLGAACLLVLLMEMLHKGFRDERELQAAIGWPVLGAIPLARRARPVDLVVRAPASVYTEAIDVVVKAILQRRTAAERQDGRGRVVLVTSAVPGEGKSVLAASVARFIASLGSRCLLIDCDLRLPTVGKLFDIPATPDAGSILALPCIGTDHLFIDPATGLAVAGAATVARPRLRAAFAPENLTRVIDMARQHFDYIILDSPPVLPVADTLALVPLADQTILAVRWEDTDRSYVQNAVRSLSMAGAVAPSAVLTQMNIKKQGAYAKGDRADCYRRYNQYYVGEGGH